jgi:CheY-like chemotaxis protein
LVVEDNLINQLVVQNILRKFRVDYAANGREAVDKVHVNAYDLIFMDCQMPVMDGCEATMAIRDFERSIGRSSRIVAMTASVRESDREACFKSGMDGFLAKPLTKDKVMDAIRRFTSVSSRQELL